ncbi:sensor histidine kinase [Actinocorallia populi]|uniref:sensor histidine kinase n=1 Tax=Actinocorallia populi TaxID=2079200 RepID=UPI0013002877|nr:histidine kinase [Actinocorallia populi]
MFVALLAMTLAGVSWHTLIEDFGVPNQVSAAIGITQASALLFALYWPVWGWWLSLGTLIISAVVAADGPLWPGPNLATHLCVLALVAFAVRPRVLMEMWVLTQLAGLLLALFLTGRGVLEGVTAMAVFSGAVSVTAGALKARTEALRRLAEEVRTGDEERARRARLEERARIARELHDVVAHHMSVIAIQAEAAPHRVEEPPQELTRAFGMIRQNAVEAMAELHRVLKVLREDEPGPAEEPQPTLQLLDELLSGVRGTGLQVTVKITGQQRPLPSGVELSAYRIIQESLSNVLRHAPDAPTEITLDYQRDRFDFQVRNGPPSTPSTTEERPGHGLPGMRERVGMLGGEFTAGPEPDGGYAVRVSLPDRSEGHDT